MKRRLVEWCELLDATGWCVTFSFSDGAICLGKNAEAALLAQGDLPESWDQLLAALSTVPLANRHLMGHGLQIWSESSTGHADKEATGILTPRERLILHWLRQGKSGPEISIIVSCAKRTTEKHISNIYRKLGVTNRAMAVFLKSGMPQTQLCQNDASAALKTVGTRQDGQPATTRSGEAAQQRNERKNLEITWLELSAFVKARFFLGPEIPLKKLDARLLIELVKGRPIHAIASGLGIRRDTVEKRLYAICLQLGLENNRQLLSTLARSGSPPS